MNNAEGKPNPGGASSEKVEIPEVDFENIKALERRYLELQQKIKDGGAEYEKAMQEDFKRLEEIKQSGAECDPKDLDKVNSILEKAKIAINGFRTKVEKINQIGYYGLLKEEEGHLKSEAANLEKETVSEAKEELSNVNERLSTISNEKNELITSKAGEIKQKRLDGKEPGYTWDEIDNTLSDQAIKPRTDEADKYMSNWDLKKAEEILEARADRKDKVKEPIAEGEKKVPDTGTEKPAVETGKGEKETGQGEKKDEAKEEEKKPEDIKSPEFKKFFQELTLEDFQNQDALKEKFKTIFTEAQFNELKIDKSVQGSAVDRYFNNFIQSAEQYLQRQVAQQAAKTGEGHKKRGAITREIKKFGKGVFGGGLYAVASRGTNLALRIGTTSGLPIKILAGGVAGAAVSGFNWATGRVGEKLTGKNIQKLAKELAKTEGRDQVEQDLRATFDRDLGVLMTFDRDRDENLNTAQQELAGVEAEQLDSIFSSGNGEQKKQELIDLMKLTSQAKNLTGADQAEAIETRQNKIKNLIENKGLDEYVTHQITTLYKELSESGGKAPLIVFPRQQQEWIKEASIMVERELNSILGDVTAQEKFAEIDKKGKSFFERGYAAKLLGKEPPQSIVHAMWNGAISGAVASFATTDATTGAIYMAMQRLQGTLRSEILKHSEKIVKTADEIERDLIHTNVAKLKEGQVRDVIRDARARIKLPDIKEIERAKIEAQVTRLENQLLKKDFFNELTQDSDLKIEALARLAVGRRKEEITEASSLAEKEKQSKSYWGLAKSFWQIGYAKKEGESGIKAFGKHLINKEKAKIFIKAGWEGAKGGVAGALGGEIVNMGGVAFAGGDVDIESSVGRVIDRVSFGLYGEARELLGEDQSQVENDLLDAALFKESGDRAQAIEDLALRMHDFSKSFDHTGVSSDLLSKVKDVAQLASFEQDVNNLSQALIKAGVSEQAREIFSNQIDSPDDINIVTASVQKIDNLLSENLKDQGASIADLRAQAFADMGKFGSPDQFAEQLALENKMGVSSFDAGGVDAADLTKMVSGAESNDTNAKTLLYEWSNKGMVGSSTIEAGGNLWNSTKEIIAGDPEQYGLSTSPSNAEVNAAVSKALVGLAQEQGGEIKDLVHEDDTLYMTRDGKLIFGAISGLEAKSLDDLSTMKNFVNLDADSRFDTGENMMSVSAFQDKMGNEGYNYELANGTKIQIMNVDRDDAVEVRLDGKSLGEMTKAQFEELLIEKGVIIPHVEPEPVIGGGPEPVIGGGQGTEKMGTEEPPVIDQEVVGREVASILHDSGIRDTFERTQDGKNEVEYYTNLTYGQLYAKGFNPAWELGTADEGGPNWAQFPGHDINNLQRIINTSFEQGSVPPLSNSEFWPKGNDTPIGEILGKIGESFAASPSRQAVEQTMDSLGFDRPERMTYSGQLVGNLLDDKLRHEGIYGLSERNSVDKLQDFVGQYAGQDGPVTRDMTIAQALTAIHDLPPNVVAAHEEAGGKPVQGGHEKEKEQDRLEIHTAEEHYQRAFSKPFPEDLSQIDPYDLSRLESEVKEQAIALQGLLAKGGLDAETQTEINNALTGYNEKLTQIDNAQAEVPPTTTAAEKVAETPIASDEIYAKLKQVGISFDEAGRLPDKINVEWAKDNVNHMWTEKGELYVVTKGTSLDMQIAIDSAKQAARATAGSYGEASQGGDASDVYGIVRGVEDINRFVQQDRTGKYVAYVVSKAKL